MRIEKISDKQIRCTLTQADLQNHHINIGELAYGSEKARSLFQEMLSQASREFNFHAENMPLMIEAVPMSGDNLVLVITKVEDPDEIDTRFSKFSPYKKSKPDAMQFDGADNIIDIFQKLYEETKKAASSKDQNKEDEKVSGDAPVSKTAKDASSDNSKVSISLVRLYTFHTLDDVIAAAHGLDGFYKGANTLYKDENSLYQLIVHQSSCTAEEFNKVCNILSEYAESIHCNAGTESHYKEHFTLILAKHALQALKQL